MSELKCEVVRDLMPLVADSVASVESKEVVEEHIAGCEYCKAYYAGLTRQMGKLSASESDASFVQFAKKTRQGFRMRKIISWALVIGLIMVALVIGAVILTEQMDLGVEMPIEDAEARIYTDVNGDVMLQVSVYADHGWYSWLSWQYRDGIVYITPEKPKLVLWNKGYTDSTVEYMNFLRWKDGKAWYVETEYHQEYLKEYDAWIERPEYKEREIKYIRWGSPDNFNTLYEVGDELTAFSTRGASDPVSTKEAAEVTATPTPSHSPAPSYSPKLS